MIDNHWNLKICTVGFVLFSFLRQYLLFSCSFSIFKSVFQGTVFLPKQKEKFPHFMKLLTSIDDGNCVLIPSFFLFFSFLHILLFLLLSWWNTLLILVFLLSLLRWGFMLGEEGKKLWHSTRQRSFGARKHRETYNWIHNRKHCQRRKLSKHRST